MSICSVVGCPAYATHRGRCYDHRRVKDWTRRGITSGGAWQTIRDRTVRRDGGRCRQCLSTSRLEVHHIDGNPANNDGRNLVTLCHDCHVAATHSREGGNLKRVADQDPHTLVRGVRTAPRPNVQGDDA